MSVDDKCGWCPPGFSVAWWRHQMETFSALLVPGEFPAQRPVTRSFDVFLGLHLNKRLNKQSWGWWFETLSRPLWRHSNGFTSLNQWKNSMTHRDRHKMTANSQTTFSNAFANENVRIRWRSRWSLFLMFQLTIFQYWFGEWLGADQATSHYLNQWWLDSAYIRYSFSMS